DLECEIRVRGPGALLLLGERRPRRDVQRLGPVRPALGHAGVEARALARSIAGERVDRASQRAAEGVALGLEAVHARLVLAGGSSGRLEPGAEAAHDLD